MPVKNLNLLMGNPVVIYSVLALYGVVTIVVLAYVRARFKTATKALTSLKKEWASAESLHAGFVGKAQEEISKLSVTAAPVAPKTGVDFDVRNQVIAMGKKGFVTTDIARSCNLPEGDVEVLLGMSRLQR